MTGSASGSLGIARVQHVANTTVLGNCYCHRAIKHGSHHSCLHGPSPHVALPPCETNVRLYHFVLSVFKVLFPHLSPHAKFSLPLETDLFTLEFFLPKMGILQSTGVYCLQAGELKSQCYNLI